MAAIPAAPRLLRWEAAVRKHAEATPARHACTVAEHRERLLQHVRALFVCQALFLVVLIVARVTGLIG